MKQFWALIQVDEELTNSDQVKEICDEIRYNVAHVLNATPAPEDTYAGN